MDTWNPIRHPPVNLTAATAIFVCAVLACFTTIDWAANVAIGIVILETGVAAVWMLDRRRPVAGQPPRP
jgi:hypothetical protein